MKKILKSKIRKKVRKYFPIIESIYKVWRGEKIIRKLSSQYGKSTHFLLMRGATGDTYLQLRLLNNMLREQKITSYVLLTDSRGIDELRDLFKEMKCVDVKGYKADCIEKAYMLLGGKYLNLTLLFPWTKGLYVNRCRVRMLERFNFMDSYCWYVLGLKKQPILEEVKFLQLNENIITRMQKNVKKGKTVILSPEANSVTQLPITFWNELIEKIKEMDYQVVINGKEGKDYNAKQILFPYKESKALLEYAGYFVGIRSGLCDIISTVRCRKIIIYPKKAIKVDYNEHRSEKEFSGLEVMGLVAEKDELIEIETPTITNITQEKSDIENEQEYQKELVLLEKKILKAIKDGRGN